MQKKLNSKWAGFGTIFNKDAIQRAMKWPEKLKVSARWITGINNFASSPDFWAQKLPVNFAAYYELEPDLFADLLNYLRKKWRGLEKGKFGKLKRFIAKNSTVPWQPGFGDKKALRVSPNGLVQIWKLGDGALALAFEKSPGGFLVNPALVTKARRWVAKNQIEYEKFAVKHVDEKGLIDIKGRASRRKKSRVRVHN